MKLVVVGAVAAGLSAASQARRQDRSLDITVLEKGQRISYGACGLPYLLEGQVRHIDDLNVYSPAFFERERNIRVRTGCEVVAVQHHRRELLLRSGERLPYDRLVWAAGARPAQRFDDPRLHVLHTDLDALRLLDFLSARRPKSAAVVGGGYIGLEVATALRARGLAVSLYQEGVSLLNRDEEWITKILAARLERCRVQLHFNSPVRQPAQLSQDLVVVCAGLKPNVEILAEAGAELGRTGALRVDDRQETSLRGIFAAGDCAETHHLVSDRPVYLPLGTTANKTGRVAGSNAAGGRERFPGICGTSLVRVAGLALASTGLSVLQARRDGFSPVDALAEGRDKPRYFLGRKVHVQLIADRSSRRLLGGAVAGEGNSGARINTIAAALHARMSVDDFAALDLAYAPPYSTSSDPLLSAASALLRAL